MILLFNGPPGSGKDTACDYLVDEHGFSTGSFKEELILQTVKYYGVTLRWFELGYTREKKDEPEELLYGISRRDALIHVSEDILKPKHGKGIFGEFAAKHIVLGANYGFSDSGFVEEALPLINRVGAENTCLVRLHRDGCSFDRDSRRYLTGADQVSLTVLGHETPVADPSHIITTEILPVRMHVVHNNGSQSEFFEAVDSIVLREQAAVSREST